MQPKTVPNMEKTLCFLITTILLFSVVAIPNSFAMGERTSISNESSFESNEESEPVLTDTDENVSEGIERTFLKVTSVRADWHAVYLDQTNLLFITVQNIAGDVWDQEYTENITAAIESIEELWDEYSGHPRVGRLEKAIEHLEDSIVLVSEHQRVESIKSVRNAVLHLNAAGQGRRGIPTEDMIVTLAEIVRFKIYTVIEEARRNFGTEHPDVQEAQDIYEDAVDKLDDGKYASAMNKFIDAFEVVLGAYLCDANIEVYSWMPDGTESEIDSMVIEGLEAEGQETLTVNWHPTRRGIHYIRVNMSGEYDVYRSPAETVESPPTIMSAGFTVSEEPDEYVEWVGDKIITEADGYNYTYPSEGYTRTQINLTMGNLIIQDGGTLIFNDNVTFVIENPDYAGQYGININAGGKFVVNSTLRSTTIVSSAENHLLTYPFHNYGTVDFLGANVMYTHGPDDLSLPAGIQNLPGSTCVLNNTNVLEADTHSVYIGYGSDVRIMGNETVIGRDLGDETEIAKGHGIWVNRSTPTIENVSVKHNRQDGIRVEGSVNIPKASEFENYASEIYDRRLTYDGENSVQPRTVVEGNRIYMAYLKNDSNDISMKISDDRGMTWNEPVSILKPTDKVERIEIAADGDKALVMWAASSYYQLIYSTNGGASWDVDVNEYEYTGLSYPAVDIENEYIYVIAVKSASTTEQQSMGLTAEEPPLVGTYTELKWGPEGSETVKTKNLEMAYSVSDIEVVGETVSGIRNAFKELSYMTVKRGRTW